MLQDNITGSTGVIGVIGNPIGHTISPQLHNTLSRELGLNLVYVPFRVENSELGTAVKGMRALNLAGFNVTIPYKQDVISHLDETTPQAGLMGAVNTVKNENGRLVGYNTDADGFARAFTEETGESLEGRRVLLAGAGGAARALAVKIALEGAARLTVINRTLENAAGIAALVNSNIKSISEAWALDSGEARAAFSESDVIINTIPVGMFPDTGICPVDDSYMFREGQIVYDAIYNPEKTAFLQKAERMGCKVVNGLGWLFYQGVLAYEIWNSIKVPPEISRRIFSSFKNYLAEK